MDALQNSDEDLLSVERQPKLEPTPTAHLAVPVSGPPSSSPEKRTVVEKEAEDEEEKDITDIDMPRPPSPLLASPPSVTTFTPHPLKKYPLHFTEQLPIAPKQLLSPTSVKLSNPTSQRKPTPIHIISVPLHRNGIKSVSTQQLGESRVPTREVSDSRPSTEYSPPSTEFTVFSAPTVPSLPPRFYNDNSHHLRRSHLPRTISSKHVEDSEFVFDFPPTASQGDFSRRSKRPREYGHRSRASECKQDFVKEYVERQRSNMKQMKREQRYPVVGQMMRVTDAGSVYAYSMREI